MAHSSENKTKTLARINRIKGQLDAFAKAIETDADCYQVMQLLASTRGALNGLMGDVVEGHIRGHIVSADSRKTASKSGEELIEIMKSFWK